LASLSPHSVDLECSPDLQQSKDENKLFISTQESRQISVDLYSKPLVFICTVTSSQMFFIKMSRVPHLMFSMSNFGFNLHFTVYIYIRFTVYLVSNHTENQCSSYICENKNNRSCFGVFCPSHWLQHQQSQPSTVNNSCSVESAVNTQPAL